MELQVGAVSVPVQLTTVVVQILFTHGDGGAFPEVHVQQFPMGIGIPRVCLLRSQPRVTFISETS